MWPCAECGHDVLEHADMPKHGLTAPCEREGCKCVNWVYDGTQKK